jgi:ribosomal protein S18 acetylase RimI-like enzyme
MGTAEPITIRRGKPEDGPAAYRVLRDAVNDLADRIGADPIPGDVESTYARSGPLFRHLAETAAEFWVAEDGSHRVVGYARSIEHGPFFELTEFFVLPERQSAGVGRQLLERAFPEGRGELRVIVATTDVRALGRYLKAGLTARTPILSLIGPVEPSWGDASPSREAITADGETLAEVAELDRANAGFDRGSALPWLADSREAILFRRDGRAIGYAFVGARGVGPIGAADPEDQPAILDEVLRRAPRAGIETIGFEVPMTNGVALRHLLARGLKIDPFMTLLLSNREFGRMDRYITYSPPIFL